jgi:large subunit ribosomal protein L2
MSKRIKKLTKINKKTGGRDATGQISVRHRGGEHKRFVRKIDWKRDKQGVPGRVASIEYDPNRSAMIALIVYKDGEKRYIVAPAGLKVGDEIIADKKAQIETGNCLLLANIPLGVEIHNLELTPGKGGQIVRGAGSSALIKSKTGKMAKVELPSGEVRLFDLNCSAVIGQVSNFEHVSKKLKKAGDKRRRGIRPSVRGLAKAANRHPHGGGHVHNIGIKAPKTPWGKKAMGKRTRKKNKYSDKYIIKRRK